MRFFLQYILPLAFPASIYIVWGLYHKRKHGEDSHVDFSKGPWLALLFAGIVLVGVGLVTFRQFDGEEPGGKYQPPVFKDGKVVPSQVIRDE